MLSAPGFLELTAGEPAVIVVAAVAAGGLGWAWPGGHAAVVQRAPEAPAERSG